MNFVKERENAIDFLLQMHIYIIDNNSVCVHLEKVAEKIGTDTDELDYITRILQSEGLIDIYTYCNEYIITDKGKGIIAKLLESNGDDHAVTYNDNSINITGLNDSNNPYLNIQGGTITGEINNIISIQDVFRYIDEQNAPETEDIKQIIRDVMNQLDQQKMPKGLLSKVADVAAKHSWVPQLISQLIIAHLFGIKLG